MWSFCDVSKDSNTSYNKVHTGNHYEYGCIHSSVDSSHNSHLRETKSNKNDIFCMSPFFYFFTFPEDFFLLFTQLKNFPLLVIMLSVNYFIFYEKAIVSKWLDFVIGFVFFGKVFFCSCFG
jgi:hypothetical protein